MRRKTALAWHWVFWTVVWAVLILAALEAEGAISDCFDATCRVLVDQDPPATGCVFEISDGKVFVLTNAHVVGSAKAVRLEFWCRGHKSLPLDGTVIARVRNDEVDAAIVSLDESHFAGRLPKAISVAPRNYELELGQTIISIGCSGGSWPTMFTGHVLSDDNLDENLDPFTLEFFPPPAGGRSGSAIFDAEGTMIVGLLYARADTGDKNGRPVSYGHACTLESLYKHLGEPGAYRTTHTGGANCPNCPGGMCPTPPQPYSLPYRRQHEREHQGQAQGNPWPTLPKWQATPPVVSLPPAESPLPIPPRPNSSSPLPAGAARVPASRPFNDGGSPIPWGLILTGAASATGVGLPVWAIMVWRGARAVRRLRAESGKRKADPRPSTDSGRCPPPVEDGPAFDFPQNPPRDTTEAKQFLRLAQLEGRDPLHDALVGRFAIDELEMMIERDGPDAAFATDLKRTLEDRFNDMVPLKRTPTPI